MPGGVKRRSKSGEVYCAVVGCHNSSINTKGREPPVKFHRFPGMWYERKRRQAWIIAVRRLNPDGTPWMPPKGARVCSTHFVGNCKSNISNHPAYIPTIFPPVYNMKAPDQERTERCQTHLNEQRLPQNTTEALRTLQASVSADRTRVEPEHEMDGSDKFEGAKMLANDTDHLQSL